MSDFNYYYTFYDKSRGDEVLMALRQSGAETKSEAIDFLIDRGYLHSDEVYDSAVANAMGDFLGISSYNPEEDEEFEAPVGTKHSALDEVHQRLRESGKKRRQQRIAKARRMKQRKFEGHHGQHHAAEMTLDDLAWITRQNRKIEQAAKNPRKNERIIGKYMEELTEYIDSRMKEAEMEMTPDIMDYPGLPVVPDSYGTNSALDSGNGVPQWYGSAETFEAPFAGAGSLFKFGGNDSALGGFTAKELTESSAIHGDFDHASLNYSGHQNLEARAEEVSGDITFTARQFVDKLHDVDVKMYEDALDTVAWEGYGRVGTWSDDGLGNMILHEDESMSAESANPTGGATGDQIVSWEHNGLSSPSGPPSDIFWSELDAEGYGDVSKYVSIDFTWDYSGEHEEAVSDGDYYITDQIKDLVESEVENGEYSGNGYYSYTVEIEDDKGDITEEDVDIDYSWG